MKYTILFDNFPYNRELQALWGFSCLIETNNKTILFDTGSNGRVLLNNAKKLEIDFKKIDMVFISHNHWDHICGLDTIIEENPNITLIVPNTLSKFLIKDLKSLVKRVIVINDSIKIDNNIYTTGMIGNRILEQALIIERNNELYIVTGCGHPGIDYIEEVVSTSLKKPIKYIIGGFHLMDKTAFEIQKITKNLQAEYITATHCTGETGLGMLKIKYKHKFIKGGVGAEINCF